MKIYLRQMGHPKGKILLQKKKLNSHNEKQQEANGVCDAQTEAKNKLAWTVQFTG